MVVPKNLLPATVLLVDDESDQLQLCAQVLRMCGFSVLTACGPVEALSAMMGAVERIDVAILDYHMPIMNGCVLADRLRSRCPELRVILHSGATYIPSREMRSVDAFIPKGGGVAPLVAQIEKLASSGTRPPGLRIPGTQMYLETGSGQS
jgi:CheY-like chemotaxis protein